MSLFCFEWEINWIDFNFVVIRVKLEEFFKTIQINKRFYQAVVHPILCNRHTYHVCEL